MKEIQMLRINKDSENVHTRADARVTSDMTRRGKQGRIDIWAERVGRNSFDVCFVDIGTYGRNRWDAKVRVSEEAINEMISKLQALVKGHAKRTLDDLPELSFSNKKLAAKAKEAVKAVPVKKKKLKAEDVPSAALAGNGSRKKSDHQPEMHQ